MVLVLSSLLAVSTLALAVVEPASAPAPTPEPEPPQPEATQPEATQTEAPEPTPSPSLVMPGSPSADEPEPILDDVSPEPTDDPTEEPEPPPSFDLQPAASDGIKPRRSRSVWGRYWVHAGFLSGMYGVSTFYYSGGDLQGSYFFLSHLGASLEMAVLTIGNFGVFHVFELTPELTIVALPRLPVTPVLSAGFGVSAFGDGRGSFGRWSTQAELRFALPWHITLGLGVDLSGLVPRDRLVDTFGYVGMWHTRSVHLRPGINLGGRFGKL